MTRYFLVTSLLVGLTAQAAEVPKDFFGLELGYDQSSVEQVAKSKGFALVTREAATKLFKEKHSKFCVFDNTDKSLPVESSMAKCLDFGADAVISEFSVTFHRGKAVELNFRFGAKKLEAAFDGLIGKFGSPTKKVPGPQPEVKAQCRLSTCTRAGWVSSTILAVATVEANTDMRGKAHYLSISDIQGMKAFVAEVQKEKSGIQRKTASGLGF